MISLMQRKTTLFVAGSFLSGILGATGTATVALAQVESSAPTREHQPVKDALRDRILHPSKILTAITGQDVAALQQLLKSGVSPNKLGPGEGGIPLVWAIETGQSNTLRLKIVKLLLDHGANPNLREDSTVSQTPLMVAAQQPDAAVVRLLLNRGADPNIKDAKGFTALARVGDNRDTTILRLLLNKGLKLRQVDLDKAFSDAKRMGSDAVLKALTALGAKPSLTKNDEALIDAVRNNDLATVRRLLAKGASANAINENAETPLLVAIEVTYSTGSLDIAKVLLEHGGAPNQVSEDADDSMSSPLLKTMHFDSDAMLARAGIALEGMKEETLRKEWEKQGVAGTRKLDGRSVAPWTMLDLTRLLLAHGMVVRNERGARALEAAPGSGDADMVDLLLQNGVNPNLSLPVTSLEAVCEAGRRALPVLAEILNLGKISLTAKQRANFDPWADEGDVRIVKALLSKGADVNLPTSDGNSPLLVAVRAGHTAVVGPLLDAGAKLEDKDREGYTPLLLAARDGQLSILKLLVNKGANLQAKDKQGRSALELALLRKQTAVVQYLKQAATSGNNPAAQAPKS
jgi:ankyrin repeat protein